MSFENKLPFSVIRAAGGYETYAAYREPASQILSLAFPQIGKYKRGGVEQAIQEDFMYENTTVFLLLHAARLVGFSSYSQIYVDPAKQNERDYFSWSEYEWAENQRRTASSGWTAIHPDFQHRGGWSLMMDAFDDSLLKSDHLYQARQVRKANRYADKVRARYRDSIVFEKDVIDIGAQTYFRIRIPRE